MLGKDKFSQVTPKFDVVLTCNYSPWSAYRGGGQKSTHMLASALSGLGKKVCVVYSKAPWESIQIPQNLPYQAAWALFFAFKPGISSPLRFLNGLSFFLPIRKWADSGTIIHCNGEEGSLLGLLSGKGKFVYSHRYPGLDDFLRKVNWVRPWGWISVLLREPRFFAMALTLRHADYAVCTSSDSAEQLRACFKVSEEKIRVIPNGLDPAFLNAPAAAGGQKGILYFGRLTQAKGVDVLLRAYAGLSERQRNSHPLTLVGEGPYLPELQKLMVELGIANRVHIEKWKSSEDLAQAILAHRLVVLPSREESFGNTMLETLATGQTLLTTDAGSIPEVTGDFAWRVPAGNAEALRIEMGRLLDAPPNVERSRKQVEYVKGRFSWEKTAAQYLALYKS